jgi:tRNA uridine 5-carbamoylmethylation protein Kti12
VKRQLTINILYTFSLKALLESHKKKEALEEIEVPHSTQTIKVNDSGLSVNLAKLTRYKRQFISLSKTASVEGNIGDMFVQYLNSQFQQHD